MKLALSHVSVALGAAGAYMVKAKLKSVVMSEKRGLITDRWAIAGKGCGQSPRGRINRPVTWKSPLGLRSDRLLAIGVGCMSVHLPE